MTTCRASLLALVLAGSVGVVAADAQAPGRPPADPAAAAKAALMKRLPGDGKTYYTLALVATKTENDTLGGLLAAGAIFGELIMAPATIIGAINGDPVLRPGMLLEKTRVQPPKQSHEVAVAVVKGKEAAADAIVAHLVTPADGKTRTWTLVNRGTDRPGVVKAADKAEANLKKAGQAGLDVTVTRRADPAP